MSTGREEILEGIYRKGDQRRRRKHSILLGCASVVLVVVAGAVAVIRQPEERLFVDLDSGELAAPTGAVADPVRLATIADLEGRTLVITGIIDGGVQREPAGRTANDPSVHFGVGSEQPEVIKRSIQWSDGCNGTSGGFALTSGGHLEVSEAISTMRGCDGEVGVDAGFISDVLTSRPLVHIGFHFVLLTSGDRALQLVVDVRP